MANKYDNHIAYLERALAEVTRLHDELEVRISDLKDQQGYLEDAIQSLKVYEHINSAKEVANA